MFECCMFLLTTILDDNDKTITFFQLKASNRVQPSNENSFRRRPGGRDRRRRVAPVLQRVRLRHQSPQDSKQRWTETKVR